MDKDALLGLAERVEGLTEPDRDMELSIWRIIDPKAQQIEADGKRPLEWLHCYTSSLDHAMTLIPEGWQIASMSVWTASPEGADTPNVAQSSVSLVGTSLKRFGRNMVWGHTAKDGRADADALSPALALTAAALRARASHE